MDSELHLFLHRWNAASDEDAYNRCFRELPAKHYLGSAEVCAGCQHIIHNEDEISGWRCRQTHIQNVSGLNVLRSWANIRSVGGPCTFALYDQLPNVQRGIEPYSQEHPSHAIIVERVRFCL